MYPIELRNQAVRVVRNRKPGETIEQIARSFGVHPMTLQEWLRRARDEEATAPDRDPSESAELKQARERIRLLEQENDVLRHAAVYLSQANLLGKSSTPS